ncbi:c-type cytochrome biogenesis protein CcmI [Aliidiomarina minuta]|uniref:C-type cytochrome biogenesis protein CcmI n=1 Tax=Aliidiomarina minuta TaxID=880057 RepID=A0A432W8J6_9GAMM|nr:c-type cytochrome biogenesis protein CcmI [Aliidiomarina minuta]RUO26351.1 c-type cytochrome biogenesis protein CcmI [Aliidiomarina minuta]
MMWYLALVILLVAAVALMVFVRRKQDHAYTIQESNRELYEARMREMKLEMEEGSLSEEEHAQAELELKKSFVSDNADDEEPIQEKPAGILIPIILLVLIAVGVYLYGDSWQQQRYADSALQKLPELSQKILVERDQSASTEDVQTLALGLRQRLEDRPDGNIWAIYGRLMMQLRMLDEALEAFERSLSLEPDSTSTLITYSQALIMSGSDSELGQAARNIRRVIEVQPMNAEALGLLGVIAFERGDYEQAVQAWEITLPLLDQSDPRYTAIEQSLEQAQERLSGDLIYVTVTVDITDELRNEMPFNANLFVFIRDPDGERAPAAVVRQRVSDFPITVTLSEEDAMMPEHTLATIDNWLLSARLTTEDTIEVRPGVMEARPRMLSRESGQQVNIIISELR